MKALLTVAAFDGYWTQSDDKAMGANVLHLPVSTTSSVSKSSLVVLLPSSDTMHLVLGLFKVYLNGVLAGVAMIVHNSVSSM